MKSRYTTKELASIWGVPPSTIHRWAEAENWRGEKRKGKGGGMVWLSNRLPAPRREQLTLALACRIAADNHSKQSSQPVNKKAKAQALTRSRAILARERRNEARRRRVLKQRKF